MRKDSPGNSTDWVERALRDVQRLHKEIRAVGRASTSDGEQGTSGPAMEKWRDETLKTLTDLHQAALSCLAPPARTAWVPRVEVLDTGTAIEMIFDLAQVSQSSIQIQIVDGHLNVSGERPVLPSGTKPLLSERGHGFFWRSVPLPIPVRTEGVAASYRDGCLAIRLQKDEGPSKAGDDD